MWMLPRAQPGTPVDCVVQSLSRAALFETPWTAAHQAPLSSAVSRSLLRCASLGFVMLSNHLILCCLLYLLLSFFLSIRIFSKKIALRPKFWSFSCSISPSNEYSGLISFRYWFLLRLTGLSSLKFKGLSRVFSRTTIWKHQFFGAQPFLWSNPHIHTWPLEEPYIWPYGALSAKWCLCFLICCLGLS